MSWLTKYLGVTVEHNDRVSDGVDEVKTITEFLADVADKVPEFAEKASDLTESLPSALGAAIQASLPWAYGIADALGAALPPVKAVLSLASFLTRETDPRALGLLAFSLAYQAALAETAGRIESDPALRARIGGSAHVRQLRRSLAKPPEGPESFDGFQLVAALNHPLLRQADAALRAVAQSAGYPEDVERLLVEGIHQRFADQFRTIISDGRVMEKFDPLFRLLSIGGKEFATYAAIRRHTEYQLWRFAKAPALGKEGSLSVQCPLAQIFVPLDCGSLSWGEIRHQTAHGSPSHQRRSPFDEDFGGRQQTLEEVLRLIANPDYDDVIIVQGTAGAGKSAFTLHLCSALQERSLRPIRIRMRDLSLDPRMSLIDDIAQAMAQNSGDDEFDGGKGPRPSPADLDFLRLLDEVVPFEGVNISPYVFIFDGWDEVSISASEGFRIRIEKTLDAIRRQFLSARSHRVRVILTGRPSEDVNEAKFLQDRTRVLTIRPFTKPQLDRFATSLLRHRGEFEGQPLPDLAERLAQLLRQFDEDTATDGGSGGSILGLPLLALLAIWLVLNDRSPPADVLTARTSLYRRLVDLTCQHGGNVTPIGPAAPRVTGDELRDRLQRTAAAMTLRGTEHISYEELMLRLEAGGLPDIENAVGRVVAENQIAKLMLSFFFNAGNREQGCEFVHKSFREYLFAEAIVEALKRFVSGPTNLPARLAYWKEFEQGDPRHLAIEELGLLLGPQWITEEVARHLSWLLGWEIRRAVDGKTGQGSQEETRALDLAGWNALRDLLADLWDWWAEGVHLRPQPSRPRGRGAIQFTPPYALTLAEQIVPSDLPRGKLPEPVRVTTLDAHLGDALFRLNCTVHFEINKATGWLERPALDHMDQPRFPTALWDGARKSPKSGRRYQTCIEQGDRLWWAFAPSSPDGINQYMENYIFRINAGGWYPGVRFPFGIDMSGIDLEGSELRGVVLARLQLRFARLSNADLNAALLAESCLDGAKANGVNWSSCRIEKTTFQRADLSNGNFLEATIDSFDSLGSDVDLSNATEYGKRKL